MGLKTYVFPYGFDNRSVVFLIHIPLRKTTDPLSKPYGKHTFTCDTLETWLNIQQHEISLKVESCYEERERVTCYAIRV